MKHLKLPLTNEDLYSLKAGDEVTLSGVLYTARDAAHKRLVETLAANEPLPVNLKNETLYFTGPTPARPGKPIGSAGPTTSYRMDLWSPTLIEKCGLRAMIGKGERNAAVIEAMKKYGAVYFAATGGAGALLSKSIVACDVVCYPDLGAEAIHKLTVEKMPLITAIDVYGGSLF